MALPSLIQTGLRAILPRKLEELIGIAPKPMEFPVEREEIERITKAEVPIGPEPRLTLPQAANIAFKVNPNITPELRKAAMERLGELPVFAGPTAIARRVVTKIPKIKSPTLESLFTFFKSISAPQKLTIKEAQEAGIALRTTKGGKVVPAVRQAGPFVPEEFATYKKYKDVRNALMGGTKDTTRAIQEIDGALSVAEKVKLPGQAGPAEKFVLWRTRDISKMKMSWVGEKELALREMVTGIGYKEAQIANRVIEKISRK